jgi:carbon-monoxide dehydrogenase medium subunit
MRYEAPHTVKEAAKLLAAEKGLARILAGGSDLLVQMKSGMTEPALILDIKKIEGMKAIKREGGGFRIGAGVSCASLRESAALRAAWPGLIDGSKIIGSTQIQGRATITGNLCNASPAADSVPALVAIGATVRIVGGKKPREVPVEGFATGPGRTVLGKGEFVDSVFLPKPKPRTGSAYLRFTPRTEMDIAAASAGVCLTLDKDGKCSSARVALGAVGPKVIVCKPAADALIGTTVDAAALARLQAAASAAATPIDDKRGTVAFRRDVVGVLARRAAEKALARARGE